MSLAAKICVAFILCVKAQDLSRDTFRQCLATKTSGNLGYCLGVGAMAKLQSLDNDSEFDVVDGVTFAREAQQYREAYNFADGDPANFRTIVDTIDHVFSQRSIHWDMNYIYPGLSLRVAPSQTPGGVLEFALDPHLESSRQHNLKEIGTGHLMARQFLVPLLLGLKFNVATIVPIVFGVLALIVKKALIVSKLVLIISSAYALGTLIFGGNNYFQPGHHYTNTPPIHSFGGAHYTKFPEQHYSEGLYRDNHIDLNDQISLRGNIPVQEVYGNQEKSKGRNFAWNDAEKEIKK